ncbi:MAG TPA: ATP cone domain-containing protein [bacterium]|nr:ATP cone domain-containing protein [bacterium]
MNSPKVIKLIRKRDGRLQEFNVARIVEAARKALHASGEKQDRNTADEIGQKVMSLIELVYYKRDRVRPSRKCRIWWKTR